MNYRPQNITPQHWSSFSLCEQLANIGSEVGRAISWQTKGNEQYGKLAFYRSLDLIDLTLNVDKHPAHLKELTRLRECLVDFFAGDNRYLSTAESWKKYFYPFNWGARISS